MKKCPSCNRAYSNAVSLCPSCGIELVATSGSGSSIRADGNPEGNNVETQTKKVVDHGNENKKTVASGWKISSVVFMMLAMLFAGLYAIQLSEYNEMESRYNRKNREYNSLNEEYEELDRVISLYDLEGKYTIDVTDFYNGTDEYEIISDELKRQNMKCLCLKWNIYDYTKSWDDVMYIDVITPDGKVFNPEAENDKHTWKIDLSDTIGEEHGRKAWFRENTWKSGTYRIVFYQGSRAIDSFEVKVN